MATAQGRGSSTSTSGTASGSTRPRCRSSAPTWATSSTRTWSSRPATSSYLSRSSGKTAPAATALRKPCSSPMTGTPCSPTTPSPPMATEVQPDDRALRLGRRERALAQMKAHDLDVLVLGRTANVRYVTGAPTIWTAGTSSFGPACMLVRATGSIHVLSTWDEGIPEDIPRENLFGLTWNPMNTIEVLRRVEGTAGARRVGTDAMSPTFAQVLPAAFPAAELVDGELAMRAARRIKTAEELAVLRQAAEVAQTSLAKAVAELRPGVTGKELAGVLLEAAAAGGVTIPADQDAAVVTSREHPWRRAGGDGRAAPGDLVAFTAGVVAHGYIAEVGRTHAVGGL